MTIALSSDFLLAFSNVQKSHQKQVREFIERFRERPDAPGLNYEVIQSAKGKDLYSVRINQAYRAVVFHPSGSSVYVLSWVDHHDEAYRWAERKQFVVHPATGALQMLIAEPSGAAPAAPPPAVEKGLFAQIKDKHLLRLGVPEELIGVVRGINSDVELEAAEISLPYRAVIVDEAQDMSAEAFRLMRAIVAENPNDLFIVGDAHQRIYRHRVSLGQCGINIKGRGKKLKINYRTTDEIRRFAVALLEGREIDDLDGGADQQKGYVSLTHGQPPLVRCFGSFAEEVAFLKQHIGDIQEDGAPLESVCVVARTKHLVEGYISQIGRAH